MPSHQDRNGPLAELLTAQRGLAHRQQLAAAGVSRGQLRWRLDRQWRMVLPGVVATFTGRLDPAQNLVAASLYAGSDAVLSSTTAARWRGVTLPPSPVVRLAVPINSYARSFGQIRVQRTRHPDRHPWRRGALTIASPGRAIADAARDAKSQRDASAIVVEAVQRGIVGLEALHRELELGARVGNRLLRAGVEAAHAAAWSMPEHDLLTVLGASSILPDVWANPVLVADDGVRLPTPDAWLDDVGLAIQVHSRRYHSAPGDWDGTVSGDGMFAEYGVPVVAFTPPQISGRAPWVRGRVERVYVTLADRPRPAVRARPRDPRRAS